MSSKKRVRFIYNPLSGENKIISSLDFIIESYQSRGYIIEPYRLGCDCCFSQAFDFDWSLYHHILIAGGDGTINGAVNEIKSRGIDLPLAVLPAGTANDFANLLGFNGDINSACLDILDGEIYDIDLGVVNGKYFVNVLSVGLFTEISQKTPTIIKNTFGKMAYYLSTVSELPNFRKTRMKIESAEYSLDDGFWIMFVFNGRTAGNLKIAFESSPNDGLLDVILVKGDSIVEAVSTAVVFFTRFHDEYPKGVVHFKTRGLKVSSDDEISADIDGEIAPKLPLEVNCIEKGLRVIGKR